MSTGGIGYAAQTALLGGMQGTLAGVAGGVVSGAAVGMMVPGVGALSGMGAGALVGGFTGAIAGAMVGGNPHPNPDHSRKERTVASTFVMASLGAAAFAAIPLGVAALSLVHGRPSIALQEAKLALGMGIAGFAGGAVAGAIGGSLQMGSHFAILREGD